MRIRKYPWDRALGRAILLAGLGVVLASQPARLSAQVQMHETIQSLRPVEAGWSMKIKTLRASPDSGHVAYQAVSTDKTQLRHAVVHDDQRKAAGDFILGPTFSPDSSRVTYLARYGGKWWMSGHREFVEVFEPVSAPLFSPDSQHVAFLARQDKQRFWVVDGVAHDVFDAVVEDSFTFSGDSSRHAYVAMASRQWFVVENGAVSRPFHHILTDPVFSPDSSQLVFVVALAGKQAVVINGQIGPAYLHIGGNVVFSADSSRLAYWATAANGKWLVVNNERVKLHFMADDFDQLLFSPDSKRLAATLKYDRQWYVLVDEREGKPYDAIGRGSLTFSADSARHAYGAMRHGKWFVVDGDRELGPFDQLQTGSVMFSPDSNRLAYGAKRNGQWRMMIGDEQGPPFERLAPNTIAFSADSSKLAYVGFRDGKQVVVVNDHVYDQNDQVSPPQFDAQTGAAVWLARRSGKYTVMVDGVAGEQQFDGLVPGARLMPRDDGGFQFVAYRTPGRQLFRLQVTFAPGSAPGPAPAMAEVEPDSP